MNTSESYPNQIVEHLSPTQAKKENVLDLDEEENRKRKVIL